MTSSGSAAVVGVVVGVVGFASLACRRFTGVARRQGVDLNMYRWEGERVVEGWTLLSSPAKYGERLGERRMSSASTDRRQSASARRSRRSGGVVNRQPVEEAELECR